METLFEDMPPDGDPPVELLAEWDNKMQERRILRGGGSSKENEPQLKQQQQQLKQRTLQESGTAIIDLMVVWTRGAECRRSDLEPPCDQTEQTRNTILSDIDAAVLYANVAYAASGVNAFLRLVDAHATYDVGEEYLEYWSESDSGGTYSGHSNAIREIKSPDDGVLDYIHNRRVEIGADVVSYVINSGEFCGMGSTITSAETVFSTIHCIGGATL